MNARQVAKLLMYQATEKHCDKHADIFAITPAFQTAFNNFKAKIAEINRISQHQEAIWENITANKCNARQTLCQTTSEVAGLIFAFASATSNNALKQEVNYSFTALFKTKDEQLAPRCQEIYDKGIANLSELGNYGITAQTLDNLQTAINNYLECAPKTRVIAEERKAFRTKIETLFDEADTILREQMDKLVVTFREGYFEFVKKYELKRVIISSGLSTSVLETQSKLFLKKES